MNNVKTAALLASLGALFVGVNGGRFPYVGRTVL
jgi:hypothetical protein